MYEVSVTARGTVIGPAPCADLDAAVEDLRQRLIDAVAPRRRVKWVVRCPSGHVVRGDITINAASTDRQEAIREHVTEIREILASDHRASKQPPADDQE
jgi:hypothetical protein